MNLRAQGRSDRPFVVTGGAGFVGSHLVDALLAGGGNVVVVDNLVTGRAKNLHDALASGRCEFVQADLSEADSLPDARGIFHLASPASPPAYQAHPVETMWVNAAGTRRVLERARASDCPVVIASTSEVYGDPAVHPQTEEYWGNVNPVGVRSCYDEGKRFSEALAMSYRRAHNVDVRIARIFNTYGPRMDPNDGRAVSNFVVAALEGKPLVVYGSGSQTRSFCYVSDLVRGLRALMDAPSVERGGPVNLGNPTENTIGELAGLVAKIAGVPLRMEHAAPAEDDPQRRCPDISRARRVLGWSPEVPLAEGLTKTIQHFQRELGRPIAA